MNLDPNARYRATHEWVRPDAAELVCGISDHAQDSLGDVVYVELPEVGTVFRQGEVFGVVESVKAASDLYCPVDGEVTAVNADLAKHPELVNTQPHAGGWMIRLKPADPRSWEGLLTPVDYAGGLK
jgi:glycine cleavage system H protein